MPLVRDRAICLRVHPYSETSQIVTLFTRQYGRLRLLAKGATRRTKAGKGKFDGGLDVLDAGDAIFSHAPERDLALLTEWKLIDGHSRLRGDLRAVWLGQYAVELVDRLLEEHDPHPRLYDGLLRLLERLAEPTTRETVFLAFQLNLLRQAGVLPDFARCRDGTPVARVLTERLPIAFDAESAQLICGDETAGRALVPPAAIESITSLLRLARGSGGELPGMTRRESDPANRLLAIHLRHQTGSPLRLARFVIGDV